MNRFISRLSTCRWGTYAVAATTLLLAVWMGVPALGVVFTLVVMWGANQRRHYQTAPATPAGGTKVPAVR